MPGSTAPEIDVCVRGIVALIAPVTVSTYPVGVGPLAGGLHETEMTWPFRVTAKFVGVFAAAHAPGNVSVTGFVAGLEPDAFSALTANV